MGRWIFKSTALILGVGVLLVGLVALGRSARDDLRTRDRYQFAFADIECTPPPGMIRRDFLDEVRYLARLPERLAVLDEAMPQKLAHGFAQHPWVEKVDKVEVTSARQVRVRLTHRAPVLAVQTADGLRVVDGHGILLPRSAPHLGLPRVGNSSAPKGPAGTRWGNPDVEDAARAAAGKRS